jgi:tetratricopeptide (TPR) repeat protein
MSGNRQSAGVTVLAVLAGLSWITASPDLSSVTARASAEPANRLASIEVQYPLDGTVFPPESIPPVFRWQDQEAGVDTWTIRLQFADRGEPAQFSSRAPEWSPGPRDWEQIKQRSVEKAVTITITGSRGAQPDRVLSQGNLSIATSKDEVGAPLFFREVNLPFKEAVKDPSQIRWRFGPISSSQPPPIVLERLPVCGNCHSFSRDGQVLGMDVDYANSKGSYVLTRTAETMVLATSDIITWDDFERKEGDLTFGLLSQVSPDGSAAISTVKDRSVFVPKPDLAFSQLFFPIKGILAVYRRDTKTFAALPGADDRRYVQSNPVWSPDGQSIVFARSLAYELKNAGRPGSILLTPEECSEFLAEQKPFRFDLYRIPYNGGRGGKAEPLEGASDDGLSNYFPRFSPDGKWIVFCKAKNYMLLQPDSELYIIPARGGKARRLRCNTARMNSWHSWSPNGRWLVFSSKAYSPYTQLCLTHIDDAGESTPPVLLSQMTAPDRAANIPEFVNLNPTAIRKIREQFLDDYSFERAANEFYRAGEADRAIEQYRQALKLNPGNAHAQQRLGFLLYHVKHQFAEGMAHSREALRLDPKNAFAQCDLGQALLHQGKVDEAIEQLSAATRSVMVSQEPRYQPQSVRFSLAQALLGKGRVQEAAAQLTAAVQLAPDYAEAHYLLALVLAAQGDIESVVEHYSKAVALNPTLDTSVNLHDLLGMNYARAGQFQSATRSAQTALRLARTAGDLDRVRQIESKLQRYQNGQLP